MLTFRNQKKKKINSSPSTSLSCLLSLKNQIKQYSNICEKQTHNNKLSKAKEKLPNQRNGGGGDADEKERCIFLENER